MTTDRIQAIDLPTVQRKYLHGIVEASAAAAEHRRSGGAWPPVPSSVLGSHPSGGALAALANRGLIRKVQTGSGTRWAPTDLGVDVARRDPVVVPAAAPPPEPKRWSVMEAAELGDVALAHELRRAAESGRPEVRALLTEAARRVAG